MLCAIVLALLLWTPLWGAASLHINLKQQAVYLLEDGQLRNSSPISSGKPGYSTPRGKFRVLKKEVNHFSATYGKIVGPNGKTVVADARSDMAVPAGCRFVKAPMPYYLGFTPRHGLHGGHLPGYPASHGCVRMPLQKAREFFYGVAVGTPVYIF